MMPSQALSFIGHLPQPWSSILQYVLWVATPIFLLRNCFHRVKRGDQAFVLFCGRPRLNKDGSIKLYSERTLVVTWPIFDHFVQEDARNITIDLGSLNLPHGTDRQSHIRVSVVFMSTSVYLSHYANENIRELLQSITQDLLRKHALKLPYGSIDNDRRRLEKKFSNALTKAVNPYGKKPAKILITDFGLDGAFATGQALREHAELIHLNDGNVIELNKDNVA